MSGRGCGTSGAPGGGGPGGSGGMKVRRAGGEPGGRGGLSVGARARLALGALPSAFGASLLGGGSAHGSGRQQ